MYMVHTLFCGGWALANLLHILLGHFPYTGEITGIILYMCQANERWCYNVASSLIGCVHSQNDPYNHMIVLVPINEPRRTFYGMYCGSLIEK